MNDKNSENLLILHEEAFPLTDEEFENIQTKLYDLSDELYNYVLENNYEIEQWNEYSETFGTQAFLTVFSCENVEINIELWERLVKERNVALLADCLKRDVNVIYSIIEACAEQNENHDGCDCDDENCTCHHHDA